jgi:hypothetical protein
MDCLGTDIACRLGLELEARLIDEQVVAGTV